MKNFCFTFHNFLFSHIWFKWLSKFLHLFSFLPNTFLLFYLFIFFTYHFPASQQKLENFITFFNHVFFNLKTLSVVENCYFWNTSASVDKIKPTVVSKISRFKILFALFLQIIEVKNQHNTFWSFLLFQGVGFAIAKCLGLNGASVVISSKNKRNVEVWISSSVLSSAFLK